MLSFRAMLSGVIALVVMVASIEVYAVTKVWDGGADGTSGNWDTAAAWVGDTIPAADDDLLFNGATVSVENPSGLVETPLAVRTSWTLGTITFDNNLPATLDIRTNASGTTARTITFTPASGLLIDMTSNAAGAVNFNNQNGNLTLALGSLPTPSGTINVANSNATLTINSIITGDSKSITKTGPGTLVLGNISSTFNGGTIVSGGALSIADRRHLGNAGVTIQNNATLRLDGTSANMNLNADRPVVIGSGGGTIEAIGGNNARIDATGSLSGTNTLTKSGSARFTILSGNTSGFTGATTIADGTLALEGAGSIAASPLIDVQSGAFFDVSAVSFTLGGSQTLKGEGTVLGSATLNGTVAPGSSPGTLSIVGDVILNGTLLAEVVDPAADLLEITGNLTLGGASSLDLPGGNIYDPLTTYTLIQFSGDLAGSFLNVDGLPGTHTLEYLTNSIALVPIPEPGSFVLAGMAIIGMGIRMRRRMR